MCDSIPSTEILLILRYQHIIRQIKQYLAWKYDIPQTRDCKGGHIKMAVILKIAFTFAYPVIIELAGGQGSLPQQPYELL